MFYFDSFYDFIMMGKHGLYVWLCFGVVLFVWIILLFSAKQEYKKQLKRSIVKAKNSQYKYYARKKNKQNQTKTKQTNSNQPQANPRPKLNKAQSIKKKAQSSTRKNINNNRSNNNASS